MVLPAANELDWSLKMNEHLRDFMCPLVAGTQLRTPLHSGTTTCAMGTTWKDLLHLNKYPGRGQTFATAVIHLTVALAGGTGISIEPVAYADDGTGAKPVLSTAPLAIGTAFSTLTSTGEKTTPMAWTEPDGWYWAGWVYHYTGTAPSPHPTLGGFTTIPGTPVTVIDLNRQWATASGVVTGTPGSISSLAIEGTPVRASLGFRV